MDDVQHTVRLIEGIIAFGVLLLTGASLWRALKMRSAIKTAWNKTVGRSTFSINEKLHRILSEVETNSGHSLKDMVTRIEDNQESFFALNSARLEADHQMVIVTDRNGKVTKISRAFQDFTGMDIAQMEGDGWINLIHPSEREETVQRWKAVVEGEREMSVKQTYVRPDNGKVLKAHVKVFRQRDSKKQLRGFLAVIESLEDKPKCPCETAHPELSSH